MKTLLISSFQAYGGDNEAVGPGSDATRQVRVSSGQASRTTVSARFGAPALPLDPAGPAGGCPSERRAGGTGQRDGPAGRGAARMLDRLRAPGARP
ncbi:hypothetical protein FHS42_004703 [Streptomyces zagrosensis]|uniref:Uncharacterized protein n=1 Tax=Streptomyces zagrosensis TaxID=1042984 RepID=A0A7W9V0A6_9ACTN|nr:hypothetical protein [Streptomyces zagrosensis]